MRGTYAYRKTKSIKEDMLFFSRVIKDWKNSIFYGSSYDVS